MTDDGEKKLNLIKEYAKNNVISENQKLFIKKVSFKAFNQLSPRHKMFVQKIYELFFKQR